MFALLCHSNAWWARQQQHLSYVVEYTSDIHYIPGKENNVADTLLHPVATVAPANLRH
jgi:hypothetical protein